MKSPKPYSVGRIVLYVPELQQGTDQPRAYHGNATSPLPAIIVRTWEGTSYENDEVNLKIFADAPEDAWHTSVPYSEGKEPGTWHWPEIMAAVAPKAQDEPPAKKDDSVGGSNGPGDGQPGKP